MSPRTSGRIVGALILAAFVLYGGGTALIDLGSGGVPPDLEQVHDNRTLISAGGLLILLNSFGVAAIGVAAFPVLRRTHEVTALAYLVTRTFEAVMLAVGAVLMLLLVPLSGEAEADADPVLAAAGRVAFGGSQDAYWFAMTGLALGSILFCRALLQARLVPSFLAVWGVVGYVLLAAGGMLEILGVGVGLYSFALGGLFELAVGVYLVVKGFASRRPPLHTAQALDRPFHTATTS